jgi:hypothetical protein
MKVLFNSAAPRAAELYSHFSATHTRTAPGAVAGAGAGAGAAANYSAASV